MAAREIKTTIVLDGEKEFKREMADAQREMRLMGAELKQVASEFDLAGDQQQYYTRRSGILKTQIQQQKNIVAAYEKAVGDMAKKHGEASKEVQDMSISLTTAQTKLNKLQKELDDNEKAAKDFGKAVEKNVEKEAKEAGKAVDSLGDELSGLDGKLGGIEGALDGLRNLAGIDLGMDLFGQVPDWVNQVLEWGQEGREWQRGEAATKYTAERAGLDEEFVKSEIMGIAAVTGDKETAQEGTRMLMNIQGITEDMLSTINDNVLGASLLFPELGYGQLAEGFQESAGSGTVTGPLLELYERSGYQQGQIDQLNKDLQNEPTQAGRAQILLTAMKEATPEGGMGFVEFLAHYKNNEKMLIDAESAKQEKDEKKEELKAALGSSPLSAAINRTEASVYEFMTDSINDPAYGFSRVADFITGYGKNSPGVAIANIMNAREGKALIEETAPTGPFGIASEFVPGLLQGVAGNRVLKNTGKAMSEAVDEALGKDGILEQTAQIAEETRKNIERAINKTISPKRLEPPEMPEIKETPKPEPTPMPTPTPVPTPLPTRQDAGIAESGGQRSAGGSLWEDLYGRGEAQSLLADPALLSEETGRSLQEAAQNIATAYGDVMQQLGIDLGADLGAGITEGGTSAIQAMQDVVDGINAAANGIVVPAVTFPMSAGGGYAGARGSAVGGNVYLDGRRVGQIMTPTINRSLGRQS